MGAISIYSYFYVNNYLFINYYLHNSFFFGTSHKLMKKKIIEKIYYRYFMYVFFVFRDEIIRKK